MGKSTRLITALAAAAAALPAMVVAGAQPVSAALPALHSPVTVSAAFLSSGVQVFVRGTDGRVRTRPNSSGSFTAIPGLDPVATGPAVVAPQYEPVELKSTNTAGALIQTDSSDPDLQTWQPWRSLSGVYTSALSAITYPEFSRLIAGRGTDGKLYVQYIDGRPQSLGGQLTSPPVVSANAKFGTIVTVRGTDGRLYYRNSDSDGQFGPFHTLGTATVESGASVTARGTRFYYRGADDALWYLDTSRAGASAVRIGGSVTSTPFALDQRIASQPERAWVYARGADGKLHRYDNGSRTWTDLGGAVA